MAAKRQSKAQYLKKRRARVRELYIHERLEPRNIARRLVDEGSIETSDESLESAIRLVRDDVKSIRAEINSRRGADADATVAFDEVDALEYELADLRHERDRQKRIADGEPDTDGKEAVYIVTMMGAGGEPIQFEKPKWPPGVRQKAGKDAALLAEKVSKLEVALAEKRRAMVPKVAGQEAGSGRNDNLFEVVTSGKKMNELIHENADRAKVN